LLNTLWAVYCQFLLLPPVKYKSLSFPNISSNYVHAAINVLTDCVREIIFQNIINKLGSKFCAQHVYCKVWTAFLYTQFNFGFQKGQLNDIKLLFGIVSPSVRNNSTLPMKYTKILHTRTHLFIHSFVQFICRYDADSFPIQYRSFICGSLNNVYQSLWLCSTVQNNC